jgi:hypothetical protein
VNKTSCRPIACTPSYLARCAESCGIIILNWVINDDSHLRGLCELHGSFSCRFGVHCAGKRHFVFGYIRPNIDIAIRSSASREKIDRTAFSSLRLAARGSPGPMIFCDADALDITIPFIAPNTRRRKRILIGLNVPLKGANRMP